MSDTHWNPFNLRTTTNVFVLPRFTKHFVSSALWSSSLIFFLSSMRAFCFFIFFLHVILAVLWIPRNPFPHVHVCCCGCFLFLLWKNPGKILEKILEILILEKSWKNPGPGFSSPSFWWFSFSVRSVLCVACVLPFLFYFCCLGFFCSSPFLSRLSVSGFRSHAGSATPCQLFFFEIVGLHMQIAPSVFQERLHVLPWQVQDSWEHVIECVSASVQS